MLLFQFNKASIGLNKASNGLKSYSDHLSFAYEKQKIFGGFMNKYLIWFPALMVLGAVIYKPAKETTETKPVSKNISFSVYKSSSYTSGVYNNTSASVDLIVEKVSTKGQHTIVWDKKLDRKYLSQYPFVENALKQIFTIHNLNREKEYLIVHYIVTYNSKGSELQMQNCTIMKYNNPGKIDISI